MKHESVAGIEYSKPTVILIQETGIGTAEIAARTCYDSFDASENHGVKNLHSNIKELTALQDKYDTLSDEDKADHNRLSINAAANRVKSAISVDHSDLLDTLAWTHFHHSILEHANLTYLIKGTSRGVLQEHSRHRIQSISVRSTRYTMSAVINAFVAEAVTNLANTHPSNWFINTMFNLDLFVTNDRDYNKVQIVDIFNRLKFQVRTLGLRDFLDLAVTKSSSGFIHTENYPDLARFPKNQRIFDALQAGKKKRNIGDPFKHLVNDTWKVDLVVTFNLRSLKNYFDLRDSGAAYFGIRHLAQAMKDVTPSKYLDLIIKPKKESNE